MPSCGSKTAASRHDLEDFPGRAQAACAPHEPVFRAVPWFGRTPTRIADDGKEPVDVERFGQVTRHLEHVRLLRQTTMTGQCNHGNHRDLVITKLHGAELPAGDARHVEIEEDEARPEPSEALQGLSAVAGLHDDIAVQAEELCDPNAAIAVILDEHNRVSVSLAHVV
jgi:hypothetical protein